MQIIRPMPVSLEVYADADYQRQVEPSAKRPGCVARASPNSQCHCSRISGISASTRILLFSQSNADLAATSKPQLIGKKVFY